MSTLIEENDSNVKLKPLFGGHSKLKPESGSKKGFGSSYGDAQCLGAGLLFKGHRPSGYTLRCTFGHSDSEILALRNLDFGSRRLHTDDTFMPFVPQNSGQRRAERVRLDESIPAVVRFNDGNRTSGRLKVVSMTGGLLSLARPVRQGSVGKLMFLTPAGSVLGSAEMLTPMSWELQPFKFVGFSGEDHGKLETAIQSYLKQKRTQEDKHQRDRGGVENFRAW